MSQTLTPKFTCIHIGVDGGLNEDNLSAHLLAPIGSTQFILLDAGTVLSGLKIAYQSGAFADIPIPAHTDLTPEGYILHHHIKAYLISHTYLDHVSGLAIISPNDNKKPLIAGETTINDIRNHLFNWRTWPNFGDSGVSPCLGQYQYIPLPPDNILPIDNTAMTVEAMPLAHGNFGDSSAFLIEANGFYTLYMGDTGPDEVEKRRNMEQVWERIAPLIQQKRFQGMFMEASYSDKRPENQLYSHLTPKWILQSFHHLAELVDPENPQQALANLTVIITHIKPWLQSGEQPREIVAQELLDQNDLGLNLVFATQGKRIEF